MIVSIEGHQAEQQRLTRELTAAKADVDASRTQAREVEALARRSEQESRQEIQTLQRSLAKAEAALDAAAAQQQRDATTTAQLRAELAGSREIIAANAARAERAEAALGVHEETLRSQRIELAQAREAEAQVRTEAAELRGQLRLQTASA